MNTESFDRYHQILFWPLELTRRNKTGQCEAPDGGFDLDKRVGALGEIWGEPLDPLDRATTDDSQLRYSEFVYFHPFAQRFLYSRPTKGSEPESDERAEQESEFDGAFYLYRRSDVKKVRVTFTDREVGAEVLDVDRIHLYVFKTQIAILAVEVSAKRNIGRRAVLFLEDSFRRVYPPFWYPRAPREHSSDPVWGGGQCPERVEWLGVDGEVLKDAPASNYEDADGLVEEMRKSNRPPIAKHWAWLVQDLEPYVQIVDDRAPSMVFLHHENPPVISESDLIRHCFYDGPGDNAQTSPYSRCFLRDFEDKFSYGRFWSRDASPHNTFKTWYSCCGYGFTTITQPGWWGDLLLNHFRHHYFQLGLLAHFHRASLLRFSSRFNEVMLREKDLEKRIERLRTVRHQLAEFISTSWFHEVSNQEQGRELFEMWTRHLQCERLMNNIMTEAAAVDEVLSTAHRQEMERAETKMAREQAELGARVHQLTILLYIVAGVTLVVAALDAETMRDLFAGKGRPLWFWPPMLACASLLGLGLVSLYANYVPDPNSKLRRRTADWGAAAALVCFLLFLAWTLVNRLGHHVLFRKSRGGKSRKLHI